MYVSSLESGQCPPAQQPGPGSYSGTDARDSLCSPAALAESSTLRTFTTHQTPTKHFLRARSLLGTGVSSISAMVPIPGERQTSSPQGQSHRTLPEARSQVCLIYPRVTHRDSNGVAAQQTLVGCTIEPMRVEWSQEQQHLRKRQTELGVRSKAS